MYNFTQDTIQVMEIGITSRGLGLHRVEEVLRGHVIRRAMLLGVVALDRVIHAIQFSG